ncbi:hypothetical protein Tsubulata_022743 [Turnera subulata]|uniref:SGNH hydrolase-type esterase domain-containing protein n=1 Tax=Turnera subulata TaxID=218843 RepID=A0A9Q0F508_9ROSI|nr:hypothetical protein Tsubulata_022743 [Turnera subulata]
MAKHQCFLVFLLLLFAVTIHAEVGNTKGSGVKLFLFGGSYADTGNWAAHNEMKVPFGMTWPGHPAGRVSDGYILTDILALFFKTGVPPAYSVWKKESVSKDELQYGMNFAYGGSGALPDAWENRTVALQTNTFLEVLDERVFTEDDLKNSVAVLSLIGNDYTRYVFKLNGTEEGMAGRAKKISQEIVKFVKTIGNRGIRKVILNSQGVVFPKSGKVLPALVAQRQSLEDRVKQIGESMNLTIVTLDYETLIKPILDQGKLTSGTCCKVGKKSDAQCGDIDPTGKKLYTLCTDPNHALYFSARHISHAGWKMIYSEMVESKILDPLL